MYRYHRRFGCVCASNQNRSMEAHNYLMRHGFQVKSYGTGSSVRLPGPSLDRPNVYQFQTPYEKMYDDLRRQNEELYTQNGVLKMLDRNRRIKSAPERFQETSNKFDIIITFEERVFEAVLDHFNSTQSESFEITYIVNLETSDTHSEATRGAESTLKLAEMLDTLPDLDDNIGSALQTFEEQSQRPILFCVQYY